jgi:hypothetical protein
VILNFKRAKLEWERIILDQDRESLIDTDETKHHLRPFASIGG